MQNILKGGLMIKIDKLYFKIFIFSLFALYYDASLLGKSECRALIHQIQDNIHALRMNIKNYGVSKATYATLDRFDSEIKSLCDDKKCCNHSLAWKLNNVRRMADNQMEKSKKHMKNHVYGGGAPLLLPVLTVGAPAAIIATEG